MTEGKPHQENKRRILTLLKLLEENAGNKPLSQKELAGELKERGMIINRNTLRDDLRLLKDIYPDKICCEKEGTANRWQHRPLLEPEEASFLANDVLNAKHITPDWKKKLLVKIEKLARKPNGYWSDTPLESQDDKQPANNPRCPAPIEVLKRCIQDGRQVTIGFDEINEWGEFESTDPSHKSKRKSPRKHTVSPYFLVSSGGSCYLLAMYPGKSKLYHFRVDFIVSAKETYAAGNARGNVKPLAEIEGFDEFDPQRYSAEHPYMQYDEALKEPAKVAVINTPAARHHFFQQFAGCNPEYKYKKGHSLIYEITASENALLIFAHQFADEAEILEPESLRKKMLNSANNIVEKYSKPVKPARKTP